MVLKELKTTVRLSAAGPAEPHSLNAVSLHY